ncbi:MAG: PAS domain-containing protein [Balneolaceae bacterium]
MKKSPDRVQLPEETLQPTNEELRTLNRELESRIEEIGQVNSDLENLISATDIPTIFLDRDICIKRYTPNTRKLFSLSDSDIGRPLAHVMHQLDYRGFIDDAEKVSDEGTVLEREIRSITGKDWYLVRFRPYRTGNNKIDGVVILFVDITEKNFYEEKLKSLNKTLEDQVEERTGKIRELASDLILAEQTERRRIADILHNDLQQQLFVIKLDIDLARKSLADDSPEDLAKNVNNWSRQIHNSIKSARDLSITLSPPSFGKVADTMLWLIKHMEDLHGLNIELDVRKDFQLPNDNLHGALFQMVRELLFNIVKHAQVDQARIRLEQVEANLLIHIEDDGCGFDMTTGRFQTVDPRNSSYGLNNIRERMELFGGNLIINSVPGKGTKMTLSIPAERVTLPDVYNPA